MPLHPFIEALLESMAGRPALSAGSPDDARAMVAATRDAVGKGPDMKTARDIEIPTRSGAIPGRILVPHGDVHGIVVYTHGGGWVLGALDDFDALGRAIAEASGCAVVMPDYRLAPEHRFPAPVEDVEDAVLWVAREGAGISAGFSSPEAAKRIVLAGDSAGGNLSAIIARRLRGKVDFALQALIYPVTDCDLTRGTYKTFATGLPLTTRDMEWFFDHYAPADVLPSPDISPIRADDLSGLPPALIVIAEYDVLADDGRAYADALGKAGGAVTLRHVPGVTHGFIRLHNLFDVARREVEAIGREIRAACLG